MDTILLIEDEAAIADTVVFALETEGFCAEWVTLGADGLARLQRPGVDLVILDVGLPTATASSCARPSDVFRIYR